MKRIAVIAAMAIIACIGAAIAFAGLRIIQLPPEGDQVGETRIVLGVSDISLVESPASYCRRTGDDDPTCAVSFRLAVAREGSVLLSLPYVAFLTPAPARG